MLRTRVSSLIQLIDVIGAGNPNPSASGPVVVEIELQGEIGMSRTVIGSYYEGEKKPDVTARTDYIADDEALRPFIQKLITRGESFITETGSSDMVCTLEWTISNSFVIVQSGPRQHVTGVFGPFPTLQDPRLKDVLVKKGFLNPFEDVEARWYANPNGIGSVMVCELNPFTADMA
ncbi:MAG: hypothetical protein PHP25_01790 [Candidatus Moranbacteria bacterium]|nr:hypothetical protein [Candidatus Moranbacteria bacterium]